MKEFSGHSSVNIGEILEVSAENPSRGYLLVQNLSTSGSLFLRFGGDPGADQPGTIVIGPLSYFEWKPPGLVPIEFVRIAADVSSLPFTAIEDR